VFYKSFLALVLQMRNAIVYVDHLDLAHYNRLLEMRTADIRTTAT